MSTKETQVLLKGSHRISPTEARRIGPADPGEQIQVTVIVRRGSKADEFPSDQELGESLPSRRNYLSRDEFAARHGASAIDIAAVRNFAVNNGLHVVAEHAGRRTVVLSGTVAAFNRAFDTAQHYYSYEGRTYRCRTGALKIPAVLAGAIEGVFGLDNRPQVKTHFRRRILTTASDVSFTPIQVANAYNFPGRADGSGEAIAIIELGGGYRAQDLSSFFGKLGIVVPSVSAISVDGGSNTPSGSADGPDGEVELDIEIAGAIAPGAKIGIYFAPNTDQGFIDALTTAAHDTNLRPSIISISWGGPEDSWTEQARNALNAACQDAATMGVTVLAASGDNGATDGSTNGALTVYFSGIEPIRDRLRGNKARPCRKFNSKRTSMERTGAERRRHRRRRQRSIRGASFSKRRQCSCRAKRLSRSRGPGCGSGRRPGKRVQRPG